MIAPRIVILLAAIFGEKQATFAQSYSIRPAAASDALLTEDPSTVSFIDTTGLGEGYEFYDGDSISVQLDPDGAIWECIVVQGSKKEQNHFIGETADGKVTCSFLRHISDDGREWLTGLVHEKPTSTWYEVLPHSGGEGRVSVKRSNETQREKGGQEDFDHGHDHENGLTSETLYTVFGISFGFLSPFIDILLGSTTTIDIMLVWTDQAECHKAGLDVGCNITDNTTAIMESAVEFLVAETNGAFRNSKIDLRLNIVYKGRDESGYDEGNNLQNALRELTDPEDGFLDDVHNIRADVGADMVMLIVKETFACGDGWFNGEIFPNGKYMFTAVADDCTAFEYAPAHILGHNFGCLHDRGTEDACDNGLDFRNAYGYREPTGEFVTIMGYPCTRERCNKDNVDDNCQKYECDGNTAEGDCPYIQYYSGPGYYLGDSLGDLDNSCQGRINIVKDRISLFCGPGLYKCWGITLFQYCFSPSATVMEKVRGRVEMKDLRVGDEVLTSTGGFQSIYSFDHFHKSRPTTYLQIHTTASDSKLEKPLELTPGHMLFVFDKSNPVPAQDLRVGDALQTLSGKLTVTNISSVVRNGLYNPLTADGTIVVDGISASTYSSFLGTEFIEINGWKVMSHQEFLDLAIIPYKTMCMLGTSLGWCDASDKEEHIALYDLLGINLLHWWVKQNSIIQTICFLWLYCGLTLMRFCQNVFLCCILLGMSGGFALVRNRLQSSKVKKFHQS